MDPVAQVLAQQNSGSAEGQGFGNFYQLGVQNRLASRRVAIDESQNNREQDEYNLIRPFIAQKAHDTMALAGQHLVQETLKTQLETESNNAVPDITALRLAFMMSPDGFKDTNLLQKLGPLKDKYPGAFTKNAPGGNLLDEVAGTVMTDHMMIQTAAKRAQAVEMADLVGKYGADPQNPDSITSARARSREDELVLEASSKLGKNVAGLITPESFDATGNWKPGERSRIINAAPLSATLQSKEDIASMRNEISMLKLQQLMNGKELKGDYQTKIAAIDAEVAAGRMTSEKAAQAREIVFGLEARSSAAGQWMERAEVTGLMKRREKLEEARILEEDKLDKLQSNAGGFTGSSKREIAKQRGHVDFYKKKIDEVNKEIEGYRPKGASAPSAPPQAASPAAGGGNEQGEDVWMLSPDKTHKVQIPKGNRDEALKQGYSDYEG